MSKDYLVIMPMPALVAVLMNRERAKGKPLTEAEVLAIRDSAECVMTPRDVAAQIASKRGYDDIDPEQAWETWNAIRPSIGLSDS